jgi:hypothetical protein
MRLLTWFRSFTAYKVVHSSGSLIIRLPMHVINVADYELVSFKKDPIGQNFYVELKESKHSKLDEQLV